LKVRPLRKKGSIIAMLVLAAVLVFGVSLTIAGPPTPVGTGPVTPMPLPDPGD